VRSYRIQHGYAQKIFSDEKQRNGLHWKAADGEPQSPIGPLVASTVAKGYQGYAESQNAAPTPYHGYYYRMLTRQGRSVRGGAKSYIANGKMTGKFAFVAYPAEYRSSGVRVSLLQAVVRLAKMFGVAQYAHQK
jgi:ribosomal protein L34